MVKKSLFLLFIVGFSVATLAGCGTRDVYEPAENGSYGYVGVGARVGTVLGSDYHVETEEQRPDAVVHEVQDGETLNDIAQLYGLDPVLILSINALDSEDDIVSGVFLDLPEGSTIHASSLDGA